MTEWPDWCMVKDWYGVELSHAIDILYCESYSDWSWAAVLVIWQDGDQVFYNENLDEWSPVLASMEEVIQMMIDFEEVAI